MKKFLLLLCVLAMLVTSASIAFAESLAKEPPYLAQRVKDGELPPLSERLPKQPLVVEAESIGIYGGTIKTVSDSPTGPGAGSWFMSGAPFFALLPDGSEVIPNIGRDWDYSDDYKTLTLYLREGMRWSDGHPFTADDIVFQFQDVYGNEELYPLPPVRWSPGGELAVAEKVNDYEVRLHFARPYPVAHMVLSHSGGTQNSAFRPKHYLKQFHPKYGSIDEIEKLVKDEGFESWVGLFGNRASVSMGVQLYDAPVLSPYVLVSRSSTHFIYERNPYFWKVDTQGNQLPYVDRVEITVVANEELATGQIIAGDVDFTTFYTTMANYPLYKEYEDAGNFRTLEWESIYMADSAFEINRTTQDPVLAEIFRDKRFSHAISMAIDRDEINEVVYFGLGHPLQATVHPSSQFYEERFAKAYVEYDPERANALLDEMGLKWDANRQYRLRPDGERLRILHEFVQTETPKRSISELVKTHLAKVGIDVDMREVSWELERRRIQADTSEMNIWHVSPVIDATWYAHEPFWCVIVEPETRWGSQWGRYIMTRGESGEKPPQAVLEVQECWDKMKVSTDRDERIRLGKRILEIQAEYLWSIGTIGRAPVPVIASKDLRNVPEVGYWGWDVLFGQYQNPETYYFER